MSDKQPQDQSVSSVFKRAEEISSRRQGPDIYDIKAIASVSTEETIEEIINNPLKCGFLLAFCESEFSTENINYILEIDRFKDSLKVDKNAWNHSLDYKSVDSLLYTENDPLMSDNLSEEEQKKLIMEDDLIVGKESMWPSKKIHFESVYHDIQNIWNKFLSHSAPEQICMPSKVLIHLKKRLENVHLYASTVFDETLLDPIKTLKKDSLPRFVASSFYRDMQQRLATLRPLPAASTLALPLPGKIPTAKWERENITEDNISEISLPDMLHDRLLYQHFMKYCKMIFTDENLFCARGISVFKCHYKGHLQEKTCPPAAKNAAWVVFRYFAAPGSVYEVSLSHRRRKMLMIALANPPVDIFDHIEKSVHDMLAVHWTHFCYHPSFHCIPKLLLEEKAKLEKTDTSTLPRLNRLDRYKVHADTVATASMFPKISPSNIVTRLFPPFSRSHSAVQGDT